MDAFIIKGAQRFENALEVKTLFFRAASHRVSHPVKLWEGQQFYPLHKGFNPIASDPTGYFENPPEFRLKLYSFADAYFIIDHGLDGTILTKDQMIVDDPSCFRDRSLTQGGRDVLDSGLNFHELDDVFIGIDPQWHNYFHFICWSMSKYMIADRFLPNTCQMVIPDYKSRLQNPNSAFPFSEASYNQIIDLSGLTNKIQKLPSGLYRAKLLRFIWVDPIMPTNFFEFSDFYQGFLRIKQKLHSDAKLPRRILISRDKASDSRMRRDDSNLVRKMCLERSFMVVRFEDYDIQQQAQIMFNAECIVAPHGAGLTNILFGRESLKVLEINYEMDGDGSLRSCFFQIACGLGQPYAILNGSRGEINAQSLAAALDFCCG